MRRRILKGLQSTSSKCMQSGPPPTPARSIPRGNVVVRAPHVALPLRSTVAPIGTSVGAYHAESSRAGALWSSSAESLVAHANVARAIVLRRTSTHAVGGAFGGQRPQISGRTERGRFAGGGR